MEKLFKLERILEQNGVAQDAVMENGVGKVDQTDQEKYIRELSLEYLQSLDIPALYGIIHEYLDGKIGSIEGIRKNVAFKKALILGWIDGIFKTSRRPGGSHQEMNSLLMSSEAGFISNLKRLGVHIDIQSEIKREKFSEKPQLLLSTHQGGGLETYVLAELLRRAGVKHYRYAIKDELIGYPVVGKVIAGRGPILIRRNELLKDDGKIDDETRKKNSEKRLKEIQRIAEETVRVLAGGENVLFFFEGTRSKQGDIANSDARRQWCYDLTDALEKAAQQYPDLDYDKSLVVLDTLSVLPVAVEKKITAPVRTNGDCTVRIVDANHLQIRENPQDAYDERTLFGKARSTLKEVLIQRIQRYQLQEG